MLLLPYCRVKTAITLDKFLMEKIKKIDVAKMFLFSEN